MNCVFNYLFCSLESYASRKCERIEESAHHRYILYDKLLFSTISWFTSE